jgi:excinuclease UvrABC nuclease subunit
MTEQPAVYRVRDKDGRLIYIGATSNVTQRLAYHRTQAWWWPLADDITTEPHRDMASAHDAEWAAIAAERPAFNLALKRGRPTSRPHYLSEADSQVCRDWLKSKRGRGLPIPLRWIFAT